MTGSPARNVCQALGQRPGGGNAHHGRVSGVGQAAFPPQVVSDDGTILSGATDGFGSLVASYEAGLYGLRERVTAEAVDVTYGVTREAVDEMTTRVLGLVPLDTVNAFYTLRGSYTSSCDIGHNDGPTARRSHYVTPMMRDFVGTLAGRFYSFEGVRLSLNDASLEFGGFFDDGARTGRCHQSHRYGIDIDVNAISADYAPCTGGSGLYCAATHPAEAPLHFRLPSAAN